MVGMELTSTLPCIGPYAVHDGVPGSGEDISVVVSLVVSLQLLSEELSGQLDRNMDDVHVRSVMVRGTRVLYHHDNRNSGCIGFIGYQEQWLYW